MTRKPITQKHARQLLDEAMTLRDSIGYGHIRPLQNYHGSPYHAERLQRMYRAYEHAARRVQRREQLARMRYVVTTPRTAYSGSIRVYGVQQLPTPLQEVRP